ncbi:MAG: phage protease [Burkholderiaceae bacterium]|nr:phage protease [Burkholderiaceae bacterium]
MKKTSIALLTHALALQASADVHLLPVGEFMGRDGRPGKGLTWKLSDAQGQALATKLNASHRIVHFNFDYEHQALLSEKNGQPAPASGWASAFAWRPGQGLYALNVQWTDKAKQMIDANEYKYISPVIAYDGVSGVVSGIVNASLTNIPALDMSPVATETMARLNALSFSQPPEQSTMNEVLKALLESLGLTVSEATTKEQAVAAVAALKVKADKADELGTEVATLKAKPAIGEPDPTKWVSLENFNKLNEQVVALSAKHTTGEVDKMIADAVSAGKCTPVVEEVWRNVGSKDVAMLKALIDKTPANPALAGQQQSQGRSAQQEQRDPKAPGTSDELAMCKNLGMTLEEFRAGVDTVAA